LSAARCGGAWLQARARFDAREPGSDGLQTSSLRAFASWWHPEESTGLDVVTDGEIGR
jgi:hypothetical protein